MRIAEWRSPSPCGRGQGEGERPRGLALLHATPPPHPSPPPQGGRENSARRFLALNLHLLRLFAAVAAHGSFSRAAEALHVSQPAVSRGVREFELQVGSRLLERGPGGVRPTAAGAALAAHARALFAAERAAEEEMLALRGLDRGALAIGASTTIATYLLPPLLAAFHRAHPAVALRLAYANTHDIVERLIDRGLDIAVVEGPVADARVTVQPWRREEMVIVARPDHRLAGVADIPPEALAGELFIVREPGSGTRDVAEELLARFHVVPQRTLEVGSTEVIKQVVAAGLGIALLPRSAIGEQVALGRLAALHVAGPTLWRTLSRLALPGRQPSAAARAFDALLDAAADDAAARPTPVATPPPAPRR
jgi:DNA-binding transcriptional LysR family regulator